MSVLQFLPGELLGQIFSSLDRHSLDQISLVSHFFNQLAESYIYASLGGYTGWLLPRLRAIVARPELAGHVRRIQFGWWTDELPTEADGILFSATAQRLGVPEIGTLIPEDRWADPDITWPDPDDTWSDRYFNWSDPVLALLLLHLVPDLRELSLGDTPLLSRLLESTLQIPISRHPFQSLVKFSCAEYSQSSCVTLTVLLALLRLPSLREFTADMEGPGFHTHDASVLDGVIAFAHQSALTHLSLHYGNMTTSLLEHVLRMPRALKHLSYCDDHEQYEHVAAPTLLQTALRAVKPTLRSLNVGRVLALQLGTPDAQSVGVLSDWPALTRIMCSLPALVGTAKSSSARLVDVLPMGIRVLDLRRKDQRRSRLKFCERWTVEEMADQLVEVLNSRAVVKLTVDTGATVYSKSGGSFNPYVEELKHRLAEAVVAGPSCGCEIFCY